MVCAYGSATDVTPPTPAENAVRYLRPHCSLAPRPADYWINITVYTLSFKLSIYAVFKGQSSKLSESKQSPLCQSGAGARTGRPCVGSTVARALINAANNLVSSAH